MILRWLFVGGLFLVINATLIIFLHNDNHMTESNQTGLPEHVLQLVNQKDT